MLTIHIAYQSFIDLLTNQGKTSSTAFLQLYSSFSDAPDPYPLLEASVESLVLSEETLPKLSSERDLLNKNVNKLTGQLEETERRLEEERIARKQLEDRETSRIKEIEASWTKVLEEKQNNWEAKEKALEEKVENQDRLLKEIKASYEVSQRLGQDDDANENVARTTASAAELEILTSDLEKTGARLAQIEARNEQLRLELAQAASHTPSLASRPPEEEPLFLRLQSENSSLLRKLDSSRLDREAEKRDWESRVRQVDRHKSQLDVENQELRSRVQKWSDYEDLRRELEMIKSIEFSTGDDDDVDNEITHTNGSVETGKKETLEQLLMARNKKLGNELTVLRMSHRDLQTQLDALREEQSMTNAELEKFQNLSSTLENDLLRVQEEAANVLPSSGMSVAGTYTSRFQTSARRGRASPTSSIISGFESQPRAASATLEALRAGEPVGGGSGILPMIQAQRDRFKQKNTQLEEELSKTYATVTSLRQEVASLQKDNLGLYEKTRYVSTYSRGQPSTTSSSSAYLQGPSHTAIQMEPDVSSRYKSQYEANISPFAAFRGRESNRALKRMTLPERVIFSITRMVLATRTSRNLFAGYCLALHFMIFLMLYWSGTMEVEKHATTLSSAAAIAAGGLGSGAGQDSRSPGWQQEGFQGG